MKDKLFHSISREDLEEFIKIEKSGVITTMTMLDIEQVLQYTTLLDRAKLNSIMLGRTELMEKYDIKNGHRR